MTRSIFFLGCGKRGNGPSACDSFCVRPGTTWRWRARVGQLMTCMLGTTSLIMAGCMGGDSDTSNSPSEMASPLSARDTVPPGQIKAGRKKFEKPMKGTNGRSCATCHTLAEHTALRPASVVARLADNPSDPLFNRIDADDPAALTPTFDHLKKGLVRITLKLPDNVNLIAVPPDAAAFSPEELAIWKASVVPGAHIGDPLPPPVVVPTPDGPRTIPFIPEIITPADRMIEVWRAVPSIANTSFSGPYLYDGRAASLQEQAKGAFIAHSQGRHIGKGDLNLIAEFERSVFTSVRAKWVSGQLTAGVALDAIARPEDTDPAFALGRDVYKSFCLACHGKATDDRVTNENVRKALFFELDHEGNVKWQNVPVPFPPFQVAVPKNVPRPGNEFLNIGTSFATYSGQIGDPRFPTFINDVRMPRYRLRFYTDATRAVQITDLPPLPFIDPNGSPFTPIIDPSTGFFKVGPNFGPQLYSPDPGRALITGDYADFEGFNIPQLRGIANTAPYFHDNSTETLAGVVDFYSRFVLPFIPELNPNRVRLGQHAIPDAQRAELVHFLEKF